MYAAGQAGGIFLLSDGEVKSEEGFTIIVSDPLESVDPLPVLPGGGGAVIYPFAVDWIAIGQ